tara:strand:- start:661 stop:1218 length:558 start_codon:yes stop_codon:yes gene_type:complete
MIITPFFLSGATTVTTTTDTYTTPNALSGGWTDYAVRIIIPNNHLSATATSTSIKISLRGPTSEATGIDRAFVGQKASSGNAWDFDGNQVQMQVSSSNSFDLPQDTTVQTDACTIALDPATDVVLALDLANNTSKDSVVQITDTDWSYHYKEGADEADETAPTGYSSATTNTRLLIKAIEWTSES